MILHWKIHIIEALPVYSKRKKQNFDSLVMDDDGNIEVEESDDEYSNDKDDTEKLLAEDDYEIFHPSKKERRVKRLWIKATNHRKKVNLSVKFVNLVLQ